MIKLGSGSPAITILFFGSYSDPLPFAERQFLMAAPTNQINPRFCRWSLSMTGVDLGS